MLHRYVRHYNQQMPQSALGSKTPLQAMKDWYNLTPDLFRKQPYHLPGCDIPGGRVMGEENRLPLFRITRYSSRCASARAKRSVIPDT